MIQKQKDSEPSPALKRQEMKYIALYAIPHACIILFCLIMIFTENATPYLSSFSADSEGRVYVVENGGVGIYHERVKIGGIDIKGGNYLVSVDKNDSIYIVYTSRVDWIDLSGNVLNSVADPYSRSYSKLSSAGNKYDSPEGDTYQKIGELGWTMIVKNHEEIVYCQSVLSFVVKLLIQLCAVSMVVSVIRVIQHICKQNQLKE